MSLKSLSTSVFKKQHLGAIICSSTRCSSNTTNNNPSKSFQFPFPKKVSHLYSKGREIVSLIKGGVRDVFKDSWRLAKISYSLKSSEDGFKLKLSDLELYHEFGYELGRLFPVLFLAALPFGNLIAVPLAVMFPRRFLTHHFWTENQKFKFSEMEHIQRVGMYLPVISELHDLDAFKQCPNWKNVLDKVNLGQTPTSTEMFKCVELFEYPNGPFSLKSMSGSLRNKLLLMHNLNSKFFKNTRLYNHGLFLLFTDYQIRHTGGPTTLPFWRLKKYCFMRGVNAHNMTETEMQNWLTQWLDFSKNLAEDNLPLILIAPALLTLHHPSNDSLTFIG